MFGHLCFMSVVYACNSTDREIRENQEEISTDREIKENKEEKE